MVDAILKADWSALITCWVVGVNVEVERTKSEVLYHFKNSGRVDSLVMFRGEQINMPFSPWVLHKYNRKLWRDEEEMNQDIYLKYCKLYY